MNYDSHGPKRGESIFAFVGRIFGDVLGDQLEEIFHQWCDRKRIRANEHRLIEANVYSCACGNIVADSREVEFCSKCGRKIHSKDSATGSADAPDILK